MPIFMNDPTMRDIQYEVGNYKDSFAIASIFSNRLSSRMSQWGEAAKTKTMELTSKFKDFDLTDASEERRATVVSKASQESTQALEAIVQAKQTRGPITSLSKLVQTRQQKLQNLQKARKSLERAKDLYKATSVNMKYDLTGYDVKAPEALFFEEQFTQAVEQRKQQYAEMYGYESFADMPETYASVGSIGYQGQSQSQTSSVGQRDILDMIMSDLTGIDYGDLVRLNTWTQEEGYMHPGAGWIQPYAELGVQDYTSDQMEALKSFFVTSSMQPYSTAKETATQADIFRKKTAETAQQEILKGQKALKKSADSSLNESLEDVQLQIRELDTDFINKLGAFTTEGPRKKKVRSVTFDEGRPQ